MTAGLPGTGLGGVFYLLCALYAPIGELLLIARGERREGKLRLALKQAGLALGVIGGIVASSMLADFMIPVHSTGMQKTVQHMPLMYRLGWFILCSVGILVMVWVAVHVLRLTVGRKRKAMRLPYRMEPVPVEAN